MSYKLSKLVFELKGKCSWIEDKIFRETSLTPAEYKAIETLLPEDSIQAAEFAQRMNLSPSRCSRIIEKMLSEGYLVINSVPGDRRSIQLSLSKKGRAIREKITALVEECNIAIEGKLTPAQIKSVYKSLEILINAME